MSGLAQQKPSQSGSRVVQSGSSAANYPHFASPGAPQISSLPINSNNPQAQSLTPQRITSVATQQQFIPHKFSAPQSGYYVAHPGVQPAQVYHLAAGTTTNHGAATAVPGPSPAPALELPNAPVAYSVPISQTLYPHQSTPSHVGSNQNVMKHAGGVAGYPHAQAVSVGADAIPNIASQKQPTCPYEVGLTSQQQFSQFQSTVHVLPSPSPGGAVTTTPMPVGQCGTAATQRNSFTSVKHGATTSAGGNPAGERDDKTGATDVVAYVPGTTPRARELSHPTGLVQIFLWSMLRKWATRQLVLRMHQNVLHHVRFGFGRLKYHTRHDYLRANLEYSEEKGSRQLDMTHQELSQTKLDLQSKWAAWRGELLANRQLSEDMKIRQLDEIDKTFGSTMDRIEHEHATRAEAVNSKQRFTRQENNIMLGVEKLTAAFSSNGKQCGSVCPHGAAVSRTDIEAC